MIPLYDTDDRSPLAYRAICRKILVLDNGVIAERDNHQQLLAQQGIYQRLWQTQESGEVS